jgi:RNA polymerase sigma-70 factor (ECF subfamily)
MRDSYLEEQPDERLVSAFVSSRDERALEVLLARHESRIFSMAYRILGNRADALDATQDVFLTVFRKAGSFRGHAAFTTWLYRLTANACHDIGRRKARSPMPMEVLPNPANPGWADPASRIAVEQALKALPEDQRVAVVMRDLYDLTYDQIAEATGVPVGTVKSRIARGRQGLGALIAGTGGVEPGGRGGRLRKQR